jgi:hypothetical protein
MTGVPILVDERNGRALADWLAGLVAGAIPASAFEVEPHEVAGRVLPSLEVRSRRYGTRVVIHVEPGL